jgi:hypothetical protein
MIYPHFTYHKEIWLYLTPFHITICMIISICKGFWNHLLFTSSLSWKLNDLSALHECTNKIRQSPTIPQTLARESCKQSMGGWITGSVFDSLSLIDIFSLAKDVLLQSKESVSVEHRLTVRTSFKWRRQIRRS